MVKLKLFFKKNWSLVILSVVIIFIGAIIYTTRSGSMDSTDSILFYSDSCTHCQTVEDFIANNGIIDKLQFEQKEVSNNSINAAELNRFARQCNLDVSQGVSIPFFYDGQTCLVGSDQIINYFETLK